MHPHDSENSRPQHPDQAIEHSENLEKSGEIITFVEPDEDFEAPILDPVELDSTPAGDEPD